MTKKPKPKVAFYWCAACGGCEEAVVDLAEAVLDVVAAVDIVFWPVALDFKVSDVEAMADGSITVSFINGAVRLSEQEEMAKLLRRKSKFVIAFGSCSHMGGVPGLANLWDKESIFRYYYREGPSVRGQDGPEPVMRVEVPEGTLELPAFWDTVKALDQVIDVDYYLPGCPPTPKLLANAVQALLKGDLPPKGSVLAGTRALCHECELNASKPEKLLLKDLRRVHEVRIDPSKCLLAQGVLCLGPVTRGGCEALCIHGNMPCTGCFGPTDEVRDVGAKGLSYVASIVDFNEEQDIVRAMEKVPDPVGVFYRYSLPHSSLKRKRGVK
ncbi:MAG: oxidoreductase [Euryarchaeota archaeon RBG_16_68_12]|nr:MAG: oxidoreductase [Euryarchaeota archaeon RBG_16_68_12]